MVERNTQIDIVVPFYNDSDLHWRKIMYNYMKEENSDDRQVIGEERYRDWENFKYWFRAVEENCKWVNKVFLIVADESQIPRWLDRNYSKLRIVLHKDYIPNELLPTFNIMTIEDYICRIDDLSNNYIYCNDDYFFLNKTTEDMFFKGNLPVFKDTQKEIEKLDTSGEDGTFYQCINNAIDLQLKISKKKAKGYSFDHLPVSHKKDFELKILKENYDYFINANNKSRFRDRNNISNFVFNCIYKDLMPYHKQSNNGCYVSVCNDTDFNEFDKYNMVCFNDTQLLSHDDFLDTKERMLGFLENKFPNKSKFEKDENMVKLQATRDFTLEDYKRVKNVERADITREAKEYEFFTNDIFECDDEMADYLTGNNANKIIACKVLEWKKEEIQSKPEEENIEKANEVVFNKEKPRKRRNKK